MKIKMGLLFLVGLLYGCNMKSTNHPKELSGKMETIEVDYIRWACDCADFIETTYFANTGYNVRGEDCIFITPANSTIKIPESYYMEDHHNYYLSLKGQYYTDKGIPDSYERKTDEKFKEKAKVFQYTSFKLVKKN